MTPDREPCRLEHGGLIDRSAPLRFEFDGRQLTGRRGDSLASALLANDIKLIGRSFKYHRPRGVMCLGSEEPNALVELRQGARREPNTKATSIELFEGLSARSQNRWPSLQFDVGAVNQAFAPMIGAGFYYKTFLWPASFWERVYEPLIRRAAGLGRLADEADPDSYDKMHAHCDVLVIGAGPAGLAAAQSAARAGAQVILCEEQPLLGGQLLNEEERIDDVPATQWVGAIERELESAFNVRLLRRCAVVGVYDGGSYTAVERLSDHLPAPAPHRPRQRLWRIVAARAVVACGAHERPLVFADNDRPGVMLSTALRGYAHRYAVAVGRRVAIFTNNDDGWRSVQALTRAGVRVVAVVDARAHVCTESLACATRDCRVFVRARIERAHGGRAVRAIDVRDCAGKIQRIDIDALGLSGGFNPALGLTSQHGARPIWSERIAAFVPAPSLPAGMRVAGAANGSLSLAAALNEGAAAGAHAAQECGYTGIHVSMAAGVRAHRSEIGFDIEPLWQSGSLSGRSFVDLQHDVTVKDIDIAYAEGFTALEHLKRYTTLGMGTDQGKTSSVNGLALMATRLDVPIAALGTTMFRAPYAPVAIGTMAGEHRGRAFRPVRLTPSHVWASEHGARFVEAGLWLRAQWFAGSRETHWLDTVNREVKAVRNAAGICDVSTLGKIDVQGEDALKFLERIYCNNLSTLAVGRVRYGLMLREDGFVFDDGTVARLAAAHFLITTTTAQSDAVLQHLEFCRQALWPEVDVQIEPVTEHWAQFAISGPRAREVLQLLVDAPVDISNHALPYMTVRAAEVCGGMPARLFRVSFSGELGYEIAIPARFGDALIRRAVDVGAVFGLTPYGLEALNVLRVEKGHVTGSEINGETTAADLNMGRMMSSSKDFIGRVLAARPALLEPDRPALIGIRCITAHATLNAGAHLVALAAPRDAAYDAGHVTSAVFSPALDANIGLGLLRGGLRRLGERIRAYDPVRNADTEVEVCHPVFVDRDGAHLRE